MKIAVCGAPMTGKRELLRSLARRSGVPEPTQVVFRDARIIQLSLPAIDVSALAATGPVFFTSEVYTHVLGEADGVCYVFAADPPGPDAEHQIAIFDGYVATARECRRLWTDVPWIFVLNKTDLGKRNPFTGVSRLPPAQHEFINTAAIHDGGVDVLFGAISRLAR